MSQCNLRRIYTTARAASMSCNKLLLDYLGTLNVCVLPAHRSFASMVNCLSTVLRTLYHILGRTHRTWCLGTWHQLPCWKTVRLETVMFENIMSATARFETVICESGLFDSVMFGTVRWARVDLFMTAAWMVCNMEFFTSLKSLAGSHGAEPH